MSKGTYYEATGDCRDELDRYRKAIFMLIDGVDGVGFYDLHEEAFKVAQEMDPGFDGEWHPSPEYYIEAVLRIADRLGRKKVR